MSILVTYAEFSPSNSFAGMPTPDDTAMHCGEHMELVVPAVGPQTVGPQTVGYSFDPEDGAPVHLPPVWRCSCGFQLDAGAAAPEALPEPVSAYESALCA